jgi:hypothetical protein
LHQNDFHKIIIDTLGLPSSGNFSDAAHTDNNPAIGLVSRRLFDFLMNSDKVIVEFRLPFQVKVLGIITHRLENLRTMFTSTDGITIAGIEFLRGPFITILREFLRQRFESENVTFGEDTRSKLNSSSEITLVPLFIVERCLYEAKFTLPMYEVNPIPNAPDRFLRSYSPSDFCLVCSLLYASLCMNVIHVLPPANAKKRMQIIETRKRFCIEELRVVYNRVVKSFQTDYMDLLSIHSLPICRVKAFQEFDVLSGRIPPRNSGLHKRPRIENIDMELLNNIYDINY